MPGGSLALRTSLTMIVVLAVTLVGCGSSPITDDGVDAFVAEVQAAVPETQAYGRDQLVEPTRR